MPEQQVTMVRVLVVDDHEVVRLGLRDLFQRSDRIQVVGECETAACAVMDAQRLNPHLVLMDLRLPDGSGVEACREIRTICPDTRVLFLTSFGDEEAVLSTAFADASGYLLKQIDGRSLIDAVERVAKGQVILDPAVTGSVLTRIGLIATSNVDNPNQTLTHQERKLLPLVAEGKTNKEIATALNLAESTVKSHLRSIFLKLQISRRSQAAVLFTKGHRT